MTIDADLRIIRKVAVGFRHIYEVGSQPKYDAGQEHRPHLSAIRGEQTPLQRAYAGRKRMEPFGTHKPLFFESYNIVVTYALVILQIGAHHLAQQRYALTI